MMGKQFGFDTMGRDYFSMFSRPAVFETGADLMASLVPIWTAVAIGLVVGWSWKPRWVSFVVLGLRTRERFMWTAPPGFGARRIWLALTAITAFGFLRDAWSKFHEWMWPQTAVEDGDKLSDNARIVADGRSKEWALTNDDVLDFCERLECRDGGLPWNKLMERSTSDMFYEAWRRESRDGHGPTEYRSRTVFEDLSPEELRDFFWDDDFRSEWDDMLLLSKTWESCPHTGSMVVQWVRKFPVFCKDREYTIGRRIWSAGNNEYYCVTKGIQYPNVPRQNAPRRVDHYFSSWYIRSGDSLRGKGKGTACEVMLFHHEDMGIQRDLAKLGIRQGMWGCVKKMGPGLKLYKAHRLKHGRNLSHSALMADVNTKLPMNYSQALILPEVPSVSDGEKRVDHEVPQVPEKSVKVGHFRWFIIGSAVALACGVDKCSVGKVLVFGLARGLGKMGERRRMLKC